MTYLAHSLPPLPQMKLTLYILLLVLVGISQGYEKQSNDSCQKTFLKPDVIPVNSSYIKVSWEKSFKGCMKEEITKVTIFTYNRYTQRRSVEQANFEDKNKIVKGNSYNYIQIYVQLRFRHSHIESATKNERQSKLS